MYDRIIPFLKRTKSSVSDCSLRDGLRDLIKSASKIFIFLVYLGALDSAYHSSWWSVAYLGLHVLPNLRQHFLRIHRRSFHHTNNYLLNNAAVVFNIIFDFKEWYNISSIQNNAEFAFIICKYNKISDKAFGKFFNYIFISLSLSICNKYAINIYLQFNVMSSL